MKESELPFLKRESRLAQAHGENIEVVKRPPVAKSGGRRFERSGSHLEVLRFPILQSLVLTPAYKKFLMLMLTYAYLRLLKETDQSAALTYSYLRKA